jgi:Protein of unknown function (Gmx_para_CXXCG)
MKVQKPHLLKPDEEISRRLRYEFDGEHDFSLPNMDCPRCTPWSMMGSEYPSIAPKDLPLALRRVARSLSLSPEGWRGLREDVGSALPADVQWEPGTEFGALSADVRGNLPDAVWRGSWTLVLREAAYGRLLDEGFDLRGCSAKLNWKGGSPTKLTEVDVRPRVKLDGWRSFKPCEICDRVGLKAPHPIVLDRKTYDPTIPIQRIVDLPTYMVVSPAMKQAMERMGLSGITFPALEWR